MKTIIKNLLCRKDFYFMLISYPLLVVAAIRIQERFLPWTTEHANYYGFLVFAVSILIAVLTAVEVIIRLFSFNLQGDKLKIREKEGVDIEEEIEIMKRL